MTENQRLRVFRKALNMKQTEFSESIGLTQGGYSDIERGKNGISNKVKMLLQQVHNINVVWLKTGNGEMLTFEPEDNHNEIFQLDQIKGSEQGDFIDKLKKEIYRLQMEKKLYKDLCEAKDKTIRSLEQQIETIQNAAKK